MRMRLFGSFCNKVVYPVDEFLFAERLGNIGVCFHDMKTDHFVERLCLSREYRYGHVRKLRVAPNQFEHFPAIESWHGKIEKDRVGFVLLDSIECKERVQNRPDLEILGFKDELEKSAMSISSSTTIIFFFINGSPLFSQKFRKRPAPVSQAYQKCRARRSETEHHGYDLVDMNVDVAQDKIAQRGERDDKRRQVQNPVIGPYLSASPILRLK